MDFDLNNLDFINYTFNSVQLAYGLFMLSFNFLLIFIIMKRCDTKPAEIMLILLLAIIELLGGFGILAVCIAKFTYGYHWYDQGSLNCQIFSFITQAIDRAEVIIVSILAVCRYLFVIHKIEKGYLFWGILVIAGTSPIVGIQLYGTITQEARPTSSYLVCQTFVTSSQANLAMVIIYTFMMLIPCWITTYCYFAVGWKANKHLNRMKKDAINSCDEDRNKNIKTQKIKLAFQLIMVLIVYNLLFMLSYVTFILRFAIGYKRPPLIDALVPTFTHASLSLNPLITITFQPEINAEFEILLIKVRAKCKKIIRDIFHRN